MCSCCGRHDGLTTGGCVYCGVRTHCASCGQLVACGCGRRFEAHDCPNVVPAGVFVPIESLFIPIEKLP